MVYRVYTEKKAGLDNEARALLDELRTFLQIDSLKRIRILNRYEVEQIDSALFDKCRFSVFAEPQLDNAYDNVDFSDADAVFGVEYLPGQFDQRADSAAQCVQIISKGERPAVRTAKIYMLYGDVSSNDIETIKKYVINPVESREASLETASTIKMNIEVPAEVAVIDGFRALDEKGLEAFLEKYSLAMDTDDIRFCRDYFVSEKRDPTITEIRMIDTYWSDHCRHTTFLTTIDSVKFEDEYIQKAYDEYIAMRKEVNRTKPINLMDIATIATRVLDARGMLPQLDKSDEINACTIKIDVDVEGETQKWLLLFKNETHNHPTEIEPFGGAATCIGGAIRDPLSGRAYVYAAMRVTGAADPLRPIKDTIKGKLPQRKIVTTAAAGYSSYGNQIGLATGQVDEIYNPGYAAKRMEIGAVVGATPADHVVREVPAPGDIVILIGGRTGRDGCGGATGSSKSHNLQSLEQCGAEVQKGNAPEERKLQRLFRCGDAARMIKRCNDFGAGGVSVAIGELADGLIIDLNAVPKKYEGLDGTELAISESQERMAVVVAPENADDFIKLANSENLEASIVAKVTSEPRMIMTWNGKAIVDLSREFLNSNGAEKHIDIEVDKAKYTDRHVIDGAGKESFSSLYSKLVQNLNVCSKRGLSERFDSTIGANTVLMPFGGAYQMTPPQAMVHKIPVIDKETTTCSVMSWGFNPDISVHSPYHAAYLAVVESAAKLIASGAGREQIYLTFQEYFEKPRREAKRWGKPLAALLGALKAQSELGMAAIGGKDSMSGSFEALDVPPTLVSFAVNTASINDIISPEFKKSGSKLVFLAPAANSEQLPDAEALKALFDKVHTLILNKKIRAAYTPTYGGIAEAVFKMCLGNRLGFEYDKNISAELLFSHNYGAFLLETDENIDGGIVIGHTVSDYTISLGNEKLDLNLLQKLYEDKLESVYSCNIPTDKTHIEAFSYTSSSYPSPSIKTLKPKALIPVFPGTNCEYDTAKALSFAGADPEIFVINNLSASGIAQSVEAFADKVAKAQIVFIPGGFSGGDEPDGSGKFITAFFRNGAVSEQINKLLKNRDGLMAGICNGFQALIKLGLVPYGEIVDTKETDPTLTFNKIGRHQSRIVSTRIASNKSPWLSATNVGECYSVAISHGEGRFLCSEEQIRALAANGQIATQYVDMDGNPTNDIRFNPNGSAFAVEGITSSDGRVIGKMGHTERFGNGLYKNISGNFDMGMFKSAVKYFKV